MAVGKGSFEVTGGGIPPQAYRGEKSFGRSTECDVGNNWSLHSGASAENGIAVAVSRPCFAGVGRLTPAVGRAGRLAASMKIILSKKRGFTIVEMMIVVVLIALLAAIAIPNIVRSRMTARMNACINNLSQLDAAKTTWTTAMHVNPGTVPGDTDIQPFLGRGSTGTLPVCPADSSQTFDTSYNLQAVGTLPTCRIVSSSHVLQ
jgi:prepilin-type N-terminal cleavage/methylation domain-containing protein